MDGAGDDGDLSRRRQPSPHHRRRPKPTPTRSAGLEEEITTAHEVKPKLKRRKKQLSGSDRLDDKQARDVDDADEAAAAELSTSVAQKILTTAREQVEQIEREAEEDEARALPLGVGLQSLTAEDLSDDEENLSRYGEDGYDDGEFSETESQYEAEMGLALQVSAEEERILQAFMSRDAEQSKTRTLADVIMEKIRDKTAEVNTEASDAPELDQTVQQVYTSIGELLRRYRSGKVPKAFKVIPRVRNWEEVLALTDPEGWSPGAMYQAVRLFASNMNPRMAQRFYNLVLLPRIRNDIEEHKRLHFSLYQALKKACYKPQAFYKGIILPILQSGSCNLREAVILSSIVQKMSIPAAHSAVALMKIAEMSYSGTNSFFIQVLVNKKYALPHRVIDALVEHFWRFMDEEGEQAGGDDRSRRRMPVIWHQSLLSFVQRYKNALKREDKERLKALSKKHRHYLVSPEIHRELDNSGARGEQARNASAAAQVRAVKEDPNDMPPVDIGMDLL